MKKTNEFIICLFLTKFARYMTDEEACISDAHEIEKDFIAAGKNLGRAFDSYGRNYANKN